MAQAGPSASSAGKSEDSRWFVRFQSRRGRALLERQVALACGLLVSAAVAVVGLWLGGKLLWDQDPLASQAFRGAELDALTSRPLDAALQFQQSLNTLQFDEARAIAAEQAVPIVGQWETRCMADGSCKREGKVVTRATLLKSGTTWGLVHAETFHDRERIDAADYEVSRDGMQWLVTRRTEPLGP